MTSHENLERVADELQIFYAHTSPTGLKKDWERLEEHLCCVSARAAEYAAAFDAEAWGRIAGLWHDLGKYSGAFQHYLERSSRSAGDPHVAEIVGRVDHSTAGAQHADQQFGAMGRLLAYCIAGHHAGLPDAVDTSGGAKGLEDRLKKEIKAVDAAPVSLLDQPCPDLPPLRFDHSDDRRLSFQASTFCRMLFSCLVDADFLATEQFMQPDRAAQRPSDSSNPADLRERLDAYLDGLQSEAEDTPVNRRRREVLEACQEAAEKRTGLFSLTVPTGGGKTLSSLAFALRHAERHNLRRVIYAIPFTSIIEQNADVFRRALGELGGTVLEHHSNLDPDDPEKENEQSRLAAENWDAPLVATTNVQLLESLFASKTSRCRKLHRIAHSVIVLDEAQALPVGLLRPTLAALEELTRNYGCSVVLCTATQPAIERREGFPIGLADIEPIIREPQPLYEALKRVEVEPVGQVDDDDLVNRLSDNQQALCIVNTRRHAAELFGSLCERTEGEAGCFHLSAQMCPAHRSNVLEEINTRLKDREPCRVVSTQLVEAGVDVDFPVVYRAMAGLDSIAQAAGRCNREGRLERGFVYVFETDEKEHRPPHFVRQAAQKAREVLPDHEGDLLSPEAIRRYFSLHYWQKGGDDGAGWDQKRVMECFGKMGTHLQFREAAERYRLIEDGQQPVIVPYGERGDELVRQLLSMPDPPGRGFYRQLQRYAVALHEQSVRKLYENAVLVEKHGRYVLGNPDAYDNRLGLRLDVEGLGMRELMI